MTGQRPIYETWQNNTHSSWWKDPGLRRCSLSIGILYLCVWSLGYDGSLLNGLQTMPRFQEFFNYPTGNRLGLISAVFYFPNLFVGFVASFLAERYGRRMPLAIGCVVLTAGAFLCGFARHDGDLIGGRVLCGAGTGFMGTIAPPLLAEFAHPRLRAVSGGLFLCTYYFGTTTSSWLCYGFLSISNDWGWRIASLMQCCGAVVILIYMAFGLMPESPRYLIGKGKEEEGLRLLAKLHSNGLEEDELVQNEFAEIKEGFVYISTLRDTGYAAFFKTSGNRKRLFLVCCCASFAQLNGVGLVSYYLAPILTLVGVTDSLQQAGINGGLAIFNWIVATTAALFVDKWGRRPLWLTSAGGILAAFIVVAGLSGAFANSGNPATGTAVIPFLFIYYGFYDIGFTVLPNLYVPEILPYHLRTKGMGIYITVQAISQSFNQWVNPVALDAIAWRYYLVYVGVQIIIFATIYFYFVETKGYTIEEVSRLLDGKAAVEGVTSSEVDVFTASNIGHEKDNVDAVHLDHASKD